MVPPPLGCVVWLHPYSYATGYFGSYVKGSPIVALVEAGFAVLAYDQVWFASRVRSGGADVSLGKVSVSPSNSSRLPVR